MLEIAKEIAYFKKLLKVNESQHITLFVVSGSIKKIFSIDCIRIYFPQSIVNYLFPIMFAIDLKV